MKQLAWPYVHIKHQKFSLSQARPVHTAIYRFPRIRELVLDLHYELELGVVLSGCMEYEYDGWNTAVSDGDVWFTGIWEPHGWKVTRAPCEVLVLTILPELVVNLHCTEAPDRDWMAAFTARPAERPQVPAKDRAELFAIVEAYRHLEKWPADQRELRKRLLLMDLLLLLACHQALAKTKRAAAASYARISPALNLVLESRKLVTGAEAARTCRLSRNQFNTLFQRLMGLGFAQFALRYRLSGAVAQLMQGDDAVKAIAAEWGFTDAAHLTHCFRRHFGRSPAAYRRARLSNP